jgi:hypothetical protein
MDVCPHRDTFAVLFGFTMHESSGDAAKETRLGEGDAARA